MLLQISEWNINSITFPTYQSTNGSDYALLGKTLVHANSFNIAENWGFSQKSLNTSSDSNPQKKTFWQLTKTLTKGCRFSECHFKGKRGAEFTREIPELDALEAQMEWLKSGILEFKGISYLENLLECKRFRERWIHGGKMVLISRYYFTTSWCWSLSTEVIVKQDI